VVTPIDIQGGPFGFIMADPPWSFVTYSPKGKEKKSAELHYGTMSLDDIKALDVAGIAAPDCLLWLWATRPMFVSALETMIVWGFTYKTHGHWVKTSKDNKGLAFGTGYLLRDCGEPYIIATRGKPRVHSRSVRSAILAPRRAHSQKPDEAYRDAELLAGPVAKADLFSRQVRPGWVAWGNEVNKFTEG
jgi:N6-adenosine-specific RNA methylase IME4